MSDQSFEIRCPRCKTVLSMDAASAHNCANQTPEAQQVQQVQQARKRDVSAITTMPVKDYHQLVRAYHVAAEGPGASRPGRLHAYLPFVILVIGLLVGGAVAFGYF